jgi:diaminopimelate decarboxylase
VKSRLGPLLAGRAASRVDLPPSRWGLAVGPNGTLWSGAIDLERLARHEGTPLHVVLADLVDRNAIAAVEAAPAGEPRCEVFFSYKTNPVPGVLRRLHGHGIGAEVISPYELWLAFRLGVPPERIVYNGPAKSVESIRQAVRSGVRLVNANSASDAATIARVAAEERRVVQLGLRVVLPGMWGGQFGIDGGPDRVVAAVRAARAERFVDLAALHLHRGMTIRDRDAMAAYVGSALTFCDWLHAETGWHPRALDLGGSLASPTVAPIPPLQHRLNRALGTDLLPPDPADCLTLQDASRLAAAMTHEHFSGSGRDVPAIILEPGRALTGDTQLLLATVLDVKADGAPPHAILDTGMNVAEPVPSEYHQLFSVTAPDAVPTTSYRLAGPICTPADVLYNNWRLPPLEPGHVLAIMDTGAYFVPFSTTFSFPRPAIVLQDGDRVSPIWRRELFDDLVRCDVAEASPERI